ncbi:glycosyl hydrolase family 28-related protein [Tsuneonella troitsensis]|uniref:glycosyl hydrolase family 28-related protein n=1 Tax=Tsuneonella troitsensis TaxID=292222 RepID=UPI00070EE00D|nr:glycosyl hydrolase family 28-related protein [Tsuneonella troitsensis]
MKTFDGAGSTARVNDRLDRRTLVASGAGILSGAAIGAAAVADPAAPQTMLRDSLTFSVRDFGALGDGVTNDGPAIRAAIKRARQVEYQEIRIVFPRGTYNVDTIDLTGTRNLTFHADGTVQLVGTGGDFILGSRREKEKGGGSVYNFNFSGAPILIASQKSARYRHAMQLYGFVQSRFSGIAVSGEYGIGEFERAAVDIDHSWVNRFEGMSVACPGAPTSGQRSIAIRCGNDNVNANLFVGCRVVGVLGQPALAGTIGIVINGNSNRVESCDVSAVMIAIELEAARGCSLHNNYHEAAQRIIVARRGNSRGCTIAGGFFEIGPDATALTLSSSESTTIVGGYYRGSGGGTFVDFGYACYGLTVIEPMVENVATHYRGIDRGGASMSAAASRLSAGGIVFPDTPVPSVHPRTLDDYREGRFAPQGPGFRFAGGTGSFTKVGNAVQVRFRVAFPPSSSSAEAALIELPFAAKEGEGEGVVLGDQRNPLGNVMAVRGNRLVVIDPRSGRGRSCAEVAGDMYSGVASFMVEA